MRGELIDLRDKLQTSHRLDVVLPDALDSVLITGNVGPILIKFDPNVFQSPAVIEPEQTVVRGERGRSVGLTDLVNSRARTHGHACDTPGRLTLSA